MLRRLRLHFSSRRRTTTSTTMASVTADDLILRSKEFERLIRRGRPTRNNWIEGAIKNGVCSKDEITLMASECRPVVHERMIKLLEDFILFKREEGTEAERELYSKDEVNLQWMVDR